MQPLTLRPYRQSDWPRLMAIHDAARREELARAGLSAAFVPLAQAAEREGLFDNAVVVAERGGEAVGFVAYCADELAWLYVDPACARQGIGRTLARYALAHTARPLWIEVLAGNAPALALYLSLGFTEVELASGRMPGNEAFAVTAHRLWRRL